jgi:hypothetical protein
MNETLSVAIAVILIGGMLLAPAGIGYAANFMQSQVAESSNGAQVDNPYLTITIAPGWRVQPSVDQELRVTHGKYLLSIDPIFIHAGPVSGGRFDEIVGQMPSVIAVTSNVDHPASGNECAQYPFEKMIVSKVMWFSNLYTDSSKTQNGCSLPTGNQPVWFGSYCSGDASEVITASRSPTIALMLTACPRKIAQNSRGYLAM